MRFLIFARKRPDVDGLAARKDIAGLVKALRYDDIEVQTRVSAVLGSFGAEAIDELLAALKKKDKNIRLGIIEALTRIKDPRTVPALIDTLSDPSTEVRWEAAIALGETGDGQAVGPLINALKDHDKYVRYGAASALMKIGWKPENDEQKAFCFVGVQDWKAVQQIGKPAIPALSLILEDRDSVVRQKAIEILGEIGDPNATPALIRSLGDASPEVRWKAVVSSPKCGIKLLHLPRGLSRRPKMTKNPLISGVLNFMIPGMGYAYIGKWWGLLIYEVDIALTIWIFKYWGETNTYELLFPIYLLLAVHAYYITTKMPEPPI